ncbi:MAG: hypothetical protein NVSMB46_01860 [Candidatus Saccharimonadales bacterium]
MSNHETETPLFDQETLHQSTVEADNNQPNRINKMKKRLYKAVGAVGIVGIAAGAITYAYTEQQADKANKVLETRLEDYGFTPHASNDTFGKVSVHESGHEVDVLCSNLPNDVVGFGVINNGPTNISLTLGAPMDRHNHPTSNGVIYHVGSQSEVQSFIKELPPMCDAVGNSLHIKR